MHYIEDNVKLKCGGDSLVIGYLVIIDLFFGLFICFEKKKICFVFALVLHC